MFNNSILDELTYDHYSGALRFEDTRYLLIRPETVVGFQKVIEETDKQLVKEVFFRGGFKGGYLSAENYKEKFHFNNKQIIKFMMKMGTEIGWGHFTLQAFDSQRKRLRTIVHKSPFAEAYGESDDSVCHVIRGVLSGLASFLFNKKCTCAEIQCLAQGHEHCVFQTGG
jgi:predicted hydrocarbon binding protein